MSRFLVHVNINPDRKHIKLHPENQGPCRFIFQNVQRNGVYQRRTEIIRVDDNTFKIAETENGYWLIVWANNQEEVLDCVAVRDAVNRLGVRPEVCSVCQ
jgi:hypothetical protein